MSEKMVLAPSTEKVLAKNREAEAKQEQKRIRDYEAQTAHESAVLELGWEPCAAPERGTLGLVEAVSWSRLMGGYWWLALIGFGVFALSVGIASYLGVEFAGSNWQATITPFALLAALTLVFALAGMVIPFTEPGISTELSGGITSASRARRGTTSYYCYTGAIPESVWNRYQRSKGQFDAMLIWSNNPDAFTTVEVKPFGKLRPFTLKALDPVLYGVKGDKWYRGGVWDVTQDIVETLTVK